MHLQIVDVHDLHSWVKPETTMPQAALKELIGYYLYREFLIDTSIYSLSKPTMGLYSKLHRLMANRLFNIGTTMVEHSLYVAEVEIKNNDAYVKLFRDVEGITDESKIAHYRHSNLGRLYECPNERLSLYAARR